ncbi:MAG: hypothetical protein LBR28_07210 [Bacteroidales bacterium]|jgi:hypothetical protein|nr:hypothetical protein [Bacteroidales bacterium]
MKTVKNNEIFDKIIKGLQLSFQRLLEEKKRNNQKIVIMKDDKIIFVTAEELESENQEQI